MALSEQERRMLQEIEQALIADDPNLARQAAGDGPVGGGFSIGIRSVAVFLLGVCLLVAGIALSQNSLWFVALGVIGFLVMFGGGLLAFRGADGAGSGSRNVGAASGKSGSGAKTGGVADRMEDSFRKRFE
ncbi:DUF3040 domain-containing protein [Corynebacterium kalidii]|uniref:DUF3040 domain-containing protein n=1 Tax=Corynebacterium kalidii TaxID=2931982 RepID=A0A9X2AZA0_9CORY|nr:DUF3040 domain-containing protein [Corynebacterium kalidii]